MTRIHWTSSLDVPSLGQTRIHYQSTARQLKSHVTLIPPKFWQLNLLTVSLGFESFHHFNKILIIKFKSQQVYRDSGYCHFSSIEWHETLWLVNKKQIFYSKRSLSHIMKMRKSCLDMTWFVLTSWENHMKKITYCIFSLDQVSHGYENKGSNFHEPEFERNKSPDKYKVPISAIRVLGILIWSWWTTHISSYVPVGRRQVDTWGTKSEQLKCTITKQSSMITK